MSIFKGSAVAMITPFNDDMSVNYDKLRELVNWQIENGTQAILALGTTAESPCLTTEERDNIVELVIKEVNGRVPVIAGSGSNCTEIAKQTSIKYEKMGADALLVITPFYNKTTMAGLKAHFKTVADAVHTPIIMYNVPGRTGMSFDYPTMAEISQYDNIAAVKAASGDMGLVCKCARCINDDFDIYSGNDDITVPLMSVGGNGVISVLANLCPKETADICKPALEGDFAAAGKMQLKYLELINDLFIGTNPIPIKEAMNMAGMNVGPCRLPLVPMQDKNREKLRGELKNLGII